MGSPGVVVDVKSSGGLVRLKLLVLVAFEIRLLELENGAVWFPITPRRTIPGGITARAVTA